MVLKSNLIKDYEHSQIKWSDEIEFDSTRNLRQYTHRLFNRYPARSINLVPKAILKNVQERVGSNEAVRVLDPFMGSGTTAVEAILHRMIPYGVEIDPFARLVSTVKVQAYDQEQLFVLQKIFAQINSSWQDFEASETFIPQLEGIIHWFDDNNFRRLLQLKHAIYYICGQNTQTLNFFRLVLADIIRPCSKAERQTLKPYISKKYPKVPADVAETWEKSFVSYFKVVEEYSKEIGYKSSEIVWLGNDAVNFSSGIISIDVAITSPPYINALDYVRCIKLESAWIDCGNDASFAKLRKGHVGEAIRSENALNDLVVEALESFTTQLDKVDKARSRVVLSYFNDMLSNLRCTYNILRDGGEYHLIVGNSVIRGIEIPTHYILASLAKALGFKWFGYYQYKIKDHRTSIPRNGQGGKIETEHVISLRKE